MPAVEIIIPNWNGAHLLSGCLESIAAQTVQDYRVVVVDNGSRDGSVAWLQREHPQVRLLALPQNLGFSVAVNAGIRAADSPLLFLLNNDTELAPDCLEQLLRAAREHPDYAFFAAKMLSFHQRHILDDAGNGMLRGGVGCKLGIREEDDPLLWPSGPVFSACAGAALYRRELFERIGLFDEDFFAYLEDVDLGLRANRSGMRCWFAAEARVFHIGSASSGATINPLTVRLSTRNNINLLVKNYPLSLWLRFLLPIAIYQVLWLLVVLRNHQVRNWFLGLLQAARSFPSMWRKRAACRQSAVLSSRELGDLLLASEQRVAALLLRHNEQRGKRSALLRLYRKLFL